MDLKQIEYILEIAKEQNITRAAQNLFITQSALTQQLIKLERELQTQLFYRSRNNWRLTPVGEIYIKNANEIMRIKNDTYSIIADMTKTQRGNLSIGFSPGRGVGMFATIYPHFHKLYPEITVAPVENLVKIQQKMIANGELDLGFISIRDEQKIAGNRYIELNTEGFYLAIPSTHPMASETQKIIDIRLFRDEPFVLISKESSMRPIVDNLFQQAGFEPKVLFETAHNPTIVTMVQHGVCCGIISQYYLRKPVPSIHTFQVNNMQTWSNYACYRTNSYLSEPAQAFVRLAKEYMMS